MDEFLSRLRLAPGSFVWSGDLKMNNIVLGLQNHAAAHPCCFCTWLKGTAPGLVPWELRAFETLNERHTA